ncbi:MAG: exo-alpha-sialidase, partial [Candidatus Thiodiazotropha sp.]
NSWLGDNPAQIILLHIGTNDISSGQDADGVANEINEILDNIDAWENTSGTDAWVILARIVNRSDTTDSLGQETTILNNKLQSLVDARSAAGDKINVVDMESALSYPDDMDDRVHPNESGYGKMAVVWFDALNSFLPQYCSGDMTSTPTAAPTAVPTVEPTVEPTAGPTAAPTAAPTVEPTVAPTAAPTAEPTAEPIVVPTVEPTAEPTVEPTVEPTPVQACNTGNYHHPAILLEEFTYEQADFPSIHASSIEELPNGDLVLVYFGGPGEREPGTVIRYQRKPVGGSWSEPIILGDDGTASGDEIPCWNPVIYQVPDGDLLFWWKVGPTPKEWWGMMKTSSDGGITWSEETKLGGTDDPDLLGPVKNKPVQLADGSLLAGSSRENDGWVMHAERSTDNGATWMFTSQIDNEASSGAIQPSILTYPDGHLQILARDRDGTNVISSTSTDYGLTWTPTKYLVIPNNNSGLDGVTLKDGRQLLVYNHSVRAGGTSVGPESGSKGRHILNVAVSQDGDAWDAVMVLDSPEKDDGQFIYPAVIQTSDGLVHITYTYHREKVKHVVINPECITDTTPMPDGIWPDYGPASVVP